MKNFNTPIGNQTRDPSACSARTNCTRWYSTYWILWAFSKRWLV